MLVPVIVFINSLLFIFDTCLMCANVFVLLRFEYEYVVINAVSNFVSFIFPRIIYLICTFIFLELSSLLYFIFLAYL